MPIIDANRIVGRALTHDREPVPWRGPTGAHPGLFTKRPKAIQEIIDSRNRADARAKARREKDAEDWIANLRRQKAIGDACNRRSRP